MEINWHEYSAILVEKNGVCWELTATVKRKCKRVCLKRGTKAEVEKVKEEYRLWRAGKSK